MEALTRDGEVSSPNRRKRPRPIDSQPVQDTVYFGPVISLERRNKTQSQTADSLQLPLLKQASTSNNNNNNNNQPSPTTSSRVASNIVHFGPLPDVSSSNKSKPSTKQNNKTTTKVKPDRDLQRNAIVPKQQKKDAQKEKDAPKRKSIQPTEVITPNKEQQKRHRLVKRVIEIPELSVQFMVQKRAVLDELGRVEIREQAEYRLVQDVKRIEISPLKLYLLRSASDQERPMMPCANQKFLLDNWDYKHGYPEPIRDRDKDWRQLLWTHIAPALQVRKDDVQPNQYERDCNSQAQQGALDINIDHQVGVKDVESKNTESNASAESNSESDSGSNVKGKEVKCKNKRALNFEYERVRPLVFDTENLETLRMSAESNASVLSPPSSPTVGEPERKVFVDHILMNKTLLLRQGKRLGLYGMIVSVFGMGIAGRVFMKKHRFPRHIRIEAYCPRLEQEYNLRVELPQLEEIFAEEPEILNPGHKVELCKRLIELLFLDESTDQLSIDSYHRDAQEGEMRISQRRWGNRMHKREKRLEGLSRLSQHCINGTLDAFESSTGTSFDPSASSDTGKTKPWLRLQRLVYSTATQLDEFYMIVTVHTMPKKKTTFVIRAYEQQTSRWFEILLSTRELARLVGDRKDPDLWDQDRRKKNCEDLVTRFLKFKYLPNNRMALSINGRAGHSGLRMAPNRVSATRRNALRCDSEAQAQAKLVQKTRIQETLNAAASRHGARKSVLFGQVGTQLISAKVPRRDIGKGSLIFRGLCSISSIRCILSCYKKKALLRLEACSLADNVTYTLDLSFQQVEALTKDAPQLWLDFLDDPERGMSASRLCEKLAQDILLLRRRRRRNDSNPADPDNEMEQQSQQEEFCLDANQTIYCRGHKLRDTRQANSAFSKRTYAYCIVSVQQSDFSVRLTAFERTKCQTYNYVFPDVESLEMIKEFAHLTHLEREVQLSVLIASLGIADSPVAGQQGSLQVLDEDDNGTSQDQPESDDEEE